MNSVNLSKEIFGRPACPIYRGGNYGSELLPKVTKLVSGGARLKTLKDDVCIREDNT